jgi:hypothetical protein
VAQRRLQRGLAGDDLTAVVIDDRHQIWLGLYGEGLRVAGLERLRRSVRQIDSPNFDSEARIFESVSSATAALLGEHGESGQVAVHEVEGRSVTFFASHQVDPPGPGYRLDRDAALVLLDDRLLEIRGGRASVVALPEGIGANVLGATLLDSRNRV